MLDKSRGLAADQVMIDLEDSVAPDAKDDARARAIAELTQGGWGDRMVSLRVNPPGSEAGRRDLDVLAAAVPTVDTIVVPKVGSTDDLLAVRTALGARPDVGLEALVETAGGLANVESIASADGLVALVFGPLDLAASLGVPAFDGDRADGYPGDLWHAARFRILVAARAAGVVAIDGPLPVLDDPERLRAAAELAAAMGYDGKWVIHPRQIEVVNAAFTPTREAFDRALAVLGVLDGAGAVGLDGLMVDEATRRVAERVVARGRAAGLDV